MAIVTFWNNNTGKIGQTHSALAIAMHMGLEHNYKTLLMSTRYNDQVIMQSFGINERVATVKSLTNNAKAMDLESGLEGMAKLAAANRLEPGMVPNYTTIILKDRLEVVAAPKKKEDADYDRIYRACRSILTVAKNYYDIIFIDLNNGFSEATTKEILKMSNIIILNMEQKPSEIEKLLKLRENTELFPPKQTLALINNYDRKSKYSTKNISREIGDRKEMLSVPYCIYQLFALKSHLLLNLYILFLDIHLYFLLVLILLK